MRQRLKDKEVTIYGHIHQDGGCGPELLGAIELLRANGARVDCIVRKDADVLQPEDPRGAYMRRLGVNIYAYEPGKFAGRTVFCLGEDSLFGLIREFEDRPEYVIYGACMSFATPEEVEAHRDGLVDEFVFQSQFQADKVAAEIREQSGRTVRYRFGYVPYFPIESRYHRLVYSEVRPADRLHVGRISRDDAHKWHPETWRMFVAVTAPRSVQVTVAGWGPHGREKAGDPHRSPWKGLLNIQTHPHLRGTGAVADFYRKQHAILQVWDDFEENYPRAVLEAFAAGTVVIADRRGGNVELIEDGVTGFLVDSTDEAAYRASQLAWNPDSFRRRIAKQAHAWLRANTGNPAKALPWWEEIL